MDREQLARFTADRAEGWVTALVTVAAYLSGYAAGVRDATPRPADVGQIVDPADPVDTAGAADPVDTAGAARGGTSADA